MSRTTHIHLVAQHRFNERLLIVSSDAYPNRSIEITRGVMITLRWFRQYFFCVMKNGKIGLSFGSIVMPHDILMTIFYFLCADIAQFFVRQCVVPIQRLIPSEHKELEHLFVSLHPISPCRITKLSSFFSDYKLGCLSRASLNADLATVQRIVEKTSFKKLHHLLSKKATTIITHSEIQRVGTPLQMALYSQDVEMVAFFSGYMDTNEFNRQWVEVFGLDYKAFLKKQEQEAETLCDKLRTMATEESLDHFENDLKDYVSNHPVHNPYITQYFYEIYETIAQERHFTHPVTRLFSQKVIYLAHTLLSPRWLQHFAQGISDFNRTEFPDRSFRCQRQHQQDIRLLVTNHFLVDYNRNFGLYEMFSNPFGKMYTESGYLNSIIKIKNKAFEQYSKDVSHHLSAKGKAL